METYTINLTPAQVDAFVHVDGFSWHSFYDANNLVPDGVPDESHMHDMDCDGDELRKLVAEANVSSFDQQAGTLTLIKGSTLEGDVRHVLEMAIMTAPDRVCLGSARVRGIQGILNKMPA